MGDPRDLDADGTSERGAEGEPYCHRCMAAVPAAAPSCALCGQPRLDPAWLRDPFAGRVLAGKYHVEQRLGCGGFGLVSRARQVQGGVELGPVVLKFLHPELVDDASIRRRFVNEARAARQVQSAHVVKVFELGEVDRGVPFMAMELLEGERLADRLARSGRLAPAVALQIALQIAHALEACHVAGVIHRDLKPANVLLLDEAGQDFVKVIDFGVARVPAFHRTQTAILFGTPKYMPPEQLRGEIVDGRCDVFALGVLLYEALTGRPPIEARSSGEYLRRNIEQPPVPLRQCCPELPEALERLLERLMAKHPDDRPASMADVAARLQAVGAERGWLPVAAGAGTASRGPAKTLPDGERAPWTETPTIVSAAMGAPAGALAPTPATSDPVGARSSLPWSSLPWSSLPRRWLATAVVVLLLASVAAATVALVTRDEPDRATAIDRRDSGPPAAVNRSDSVAAPVGDTVDVGAGGEADGSHGEGRAPGDAGRRGFRRRKGWRKVPGGL